VSSLHRLCAAAAAAAAADCRYGAYGSKQWPSLNPADLALRAAFALLLLLLLLAVGMVRMAASSGQASTLLT
jgi:hypothetical protein